MNIKLIKKDNYIYKLIKSNPKKIQKYKIIEIIDNFEECNLCDNSTQYFVKLENPQHNDDIYCIFFEKDIK
jgi:hypothetical protein